MQSRLHRSSLVLTEQKQHHMNPRRLLLSTFIFAMLIVLWSLVEIFWKEEIALPGWLNYKLFIVTAGPGVVYPLIVWFSAVKQNPFRMILYVILSSAVYAGVVKLATRGYHFTTEDPLFFIFAGSVGAICFLLLTKFLVRPPITTSAVLWGILVGAVSFFPVMMEIDNRLYSGSFACWIMSIGAVMAASTINRK